MSSAWPLLNQPPELLSGQVHVWSLALDLADYAYVLETGRLVVTGKPDELWNNEDVRAAYLGGHARSAQA